MDFQAANQYLLQTLRDNLDIRLTYHNFIHTVDVFDATIRISTYENLSETETSILGTAALFHDAGMLDGYADHERRSVDFAQRVLPTFGYTSDEIAQISALILATSMPQKPTSLLQAILCDADLDYLGTSYFFSRSFNLKQEWEIFIPKKYSLAEWFKHQIEFLESHTYHTRNAQQLREPIKREHVASIKALLYPLPSMPSQNE